jgi:hypothetical protein
MSMVLYLFILVFHVNFCDRDEEEVGMDLAYVVEDAGDLGVQLSLVCSGCRGLCFTQTSSHKHST